MHELSVGKPYIPGRTNYPQIIEYSYRGGQHELRLILPGLTIAEIRDIRKGEAEFALVWSPPVLILLYRFGRAVSWSDAPSTVHLVPSEERRPPYDLPTPNSRAILNVILVDATSGIVRGLRLVSFSPAFSRELHAALTEQAALPWDPAAYDQALANLYRRYRSTEQLLRVVSVHCIGGE